MKRYNIEIEGETTTDLIYALDEVKKALEKGYTSGIDSNDSGRYLFEEARQ